MILYKYFPPQRIDVLQNIRIRFSQPAIYNDPFELNPVFTSEITEELFNKIMPTLVNHHGGSLREKEEISQITYVDFRNDQKRVLGLIQQVMASGSLSLSLTEVPDSLLMWAHYGGMHTGFVLGFDADHEFFTCKKGTYFAQKIIYQVRRPLVNLSKFDSLLTYFTKSIDWEYEREWRLFKPAIGDPSGVDLAGFPIYLFDVPPAAIKEIILGCRMEIVSQQAIIDNLKVKGSRVKVKHAQLDIENYALRIIDH